MEADDRFAVMLSDREIVLLCEALDSYEYWEPGHYLPRNNGMVFIPGDFLGARDRYWDGCVPTEEQLEAIEEVTKCRMLAARIAECAGLAGRATRSL